MAVDLEQLALKSIEQYAALNVKLEALTLAISDANRKAETSQDKFIDACNKITRLEEKIVTLFEERVLIHRRIDDTREEVDKLVGIVREITGSIKDHQDDHCKDCINAVKILDIESRLTLLSKEDKDLREVQRKLTSPHGLMFLRFVISRTGIVWFTLLSIASVLTLYSNYAILKKIWDMTHFVSTP